jgi:hypothetical protein
MYETKNRQYYSGPSSLYYPSTPYNKFIPILALDKNNHIIDNSNSFLTDDGFANQDINSINNYNNYHCIFSGLQNSYNILLEKKEETIKIDDNIFLLFNPFSGRNSGHDLSILFTKIHHYRTNQLDTPVIVGDTMNDFPFTLDICRLLLPEVKFYSLIPNKIYEFKNILITSNCIFDINRHKFV